MIQNWNQEYKDRVQTVNDVLSGYISGYTSQIPKYVICVQTADMVAKLLNS